MALSIRKLPGYTGQEGCMRCGAHTGTRHYGTEVSVGDIIGFSGWRGPYCSAKCYRMDYPNIEDFEPLPQET